MKPKVFSFLISLSAVLLSGCTHYYYVPNVQNVPLFKEKNEFRFSGSVGIGDESESYEIQAAHSVSDRIGIMGNFMYAQDNYEDNRYGKGSYFDGAIGYYKPIIDEDSGYGVFEIYGGIGRSTQHHLYDNRARSDLSFIKLFIQPSFGLTTNFLDLAVSTRINRLSFGNANISKPIPSDQICPKELSGKNYLLLEPAVTARFGWKNVKVQFQLEGVYDLNNSNPDFYEDYHISLGLYFSFAERFKK